MILRISSGLLKNKKLTVAQKTKPVRERVKLAIFSILGDDIKDKSILDLFSGSGNLGFEAISRGASSATLVEEDYYAIEALQKNLKELITKDLPVNRIVNIEKSEATKYVANADEHYDIVFADPPYELTIIHILKYIDQIMNENGLMIYLHDTKYHYDLSEINKNLILMDTRSFGITTIDFIKKR